MRFVECFDIFLILGIVEQYREVSDLTDRADQRRVRKGSAGERLLRGLRDSISVNDQNIAPEIGLYLNIDRLGKPECVVPVCHPFLSLHKIGFPLCDICGCNGFLNCCFDPLVDRSRLNAVPNHLLYGAY